MQTCLPGNLQRPFPVSGAYIKQRLASPSNSGDRKLINTLQVWFSPLGDVSKEGRDPVISCNGIENIITWSFHYIRLRNEILIFLCARGSEAFAIERFSR